MVRHFPIRPSRKNSGLSIFYTAATETGYCDTGPRDGGSHTGAGVEFGNQDTYPVIRADALIEFLHPKWLPK